MKLLANNYDLNNKNILITGAGSGIGKAFALQAAKNKANLILMSKNQEKLEKLDDEIFALTGKKSILIPLDLKTASKQEFLEIVDFLTNEIEVLDGVLLNASILGKKQPILDVQENIFNEVMQVNFTSSLLLIQSLFPLLEKSQKASIVFVSSSVGRKPRAFWSSYAISKASIEALMQILAQELEIHPNIFINSVNPGATNTDMRYQAYPGEDKSTIATTNEVATKYLYLFSNELTEKAQQFDAQ